MARILGLVTIKLGDVAGDGGMGASLTSIGDTVKDSCVFTESEPTKSDFFVEESDDPIESIVTQKGIETITWSTYNTSPQNMARLFGGTVAGAGTEVSPYTWEPPDTQSEVEQSIEIVDRKGNKLEVVRAKIQATKNLTFQASTLGSVNIVATVLTPTKANTKKYKFTYAV